MADSPRLGSSPSSLEQARSRIVELEAEVLALRDRLALEGSLARHSLDYVFAIDTEGNFLSVNPAAERDYGYSLQEFRQLHITDVLDPTQHAEMQELLAARLEGRHDSRLVQVLTRTRGGDPIWVELRTHRLFHPDGTLRGLQGIARSVNEESDTRLRVLFDEAPDAIVITHGETNEVLDVNAQMSTLLGFTRDDLIGRHAPRLVSEADQARIGALFGQLEVGRRFQAECDLIARDGARVPTEIVVNRLADGRFLVAIRDISDRREVEVALHGSEQRYRSLVDQASDPIFEVGADGRIRFTNEACTTVLGFSQDELAQLPFGSLVTDPERDRLAVRAWLRSGGRTGALLQEVRTKSGATVWLEARGVPLPGPEGEFASILGIARDITASKRAAEEAEAARLALAERDAQLRTVLSSLPIMIFTLDREGHVTFAEGRIMEQLGMRSEDVLGLPLEEVPLMRDEFRAGFGAAIAGGHAHQAWRANGRVADAHFAPLRGAQREIIGVVGIALDSTERERQREELERSRHSLQRAQEAGQLGTWEVDSGTFELHASDEALRIFGVRPRESLQLTADHFWGRVHPDDLDRVRSAIIGRRSQDPAYVEHRILRSDGEIRHVAQRTELVRDAGGEITRMIGMVQDITERRRTQDALEASEQQLQSLVRTAPVIIFATDADGVFTMTDGKGLADIDLEPGMRVGESAFDAGAGRFREAVTRALRGEEVVETFDLTGVLFEHHYTPLRDAAGEITGVVGVCVNVHEQRRLEEQLRQAKKMEAIGRLAGGIAHDFNNVLSVITGYTELALLSVSETHPLYESLGEIKQAGQSAAALTRQLLAFSRRQVLEPETVNLADVVRELQPMLRRIIEEDVRIETELEPEGCLLRADPGQVEQVVMNLVVNARDAMSEGGIITIGAARTQLDAATATRLGLDGPKACVILSVSDQGHGMDAETRERVFEPFFTTKDVGEGTGLGLATVYGIVSQSGGAVDVESEPGRGATFRIYFPAVAAEASTSPASQSGLPRGDERILLVEDEAAVRSIVRRVLTDCGYDVVTASSGREALERVQQSPRPFDLLFTDIVMPGMRGPELAARMREIHPGLRVLFTSGYVDNEPVELGTQGPGAGYLQKPVSYTEIAREVRHVLDAPAPRPAVDIPRS